MEPRGTQPCPRGASQQSVLLHTTEMVVAEEGGPGWHKPTSLHSPNSLPAEDNSPLLLSSALLVLSQPLNVSVTTVTKLNSPSCHTVDAEIHVKAVHTFHLPITSLHYTH